MKLRDVSYEDLSSWPEKILFTFSKTPGFGIKTRCRMFMMQWPELKERTSSAIDIVQKSCNEIKNSTKLKITFAAVLQVIIHAIYYLY